MTNDPVIQKFGPMGCNDFIVASSTVDSEHASLLHRPSLSFHPKDLPRDCLGYVTASLTCKSRWLEQLPFSAPHCRSSWPRDGSLDWMNSKYVPRQPPMWV